MQLIEALKQKQGGMSQAEFAEQLGVSEALLSLVYAGKRQVGESTARRIAARYPELLWLVTAYVMTKEDTCPNKTA